MAYTIQIKVINEHGTSAEATIGNEVELDETIRELKRLADEYEREDDRSRLRFDPSPDAEPEDRPVPDVQASECPQWRPSTWDILRGPVRPRDFADNRFHNPKD